MNQHNRPRIITGNWKMNKTSAQAVDFIHHLLPLLNINGTEPLLAVPFTSIQSSAFAAKGSPLIIGAQNMNDASEGAFTGEIAGAMLREAGAQFVILGHSERRRFFNETNELINKKIKRALIESLRPVLCIGESSEEKEAGITQEVLKTQLYECLLGINPEKLRDLIVAYEPVWAIGAEQGATPEHAQLVHHECRNYLAELLGSNVATEIVIQYGGTVNSTNAHLFLEQPDIDGLLIGRASLTVESFAEIINGKSVTVRTLNNLQTLEKNEDET